VNPEILEPLNTRQVNIGLDVQPKFAKIGDYWDEDIVNKVTELLRKYQDLFEGNSRGSGCNEDHLKT